MPGKPRPIRRISAGQRPEAHVEASERLVQAPESQHPGDEVAEPKSGPQPDRASLGSIEATRPRKELHQQGRAVPHAPRRMEPNPFGHSPRPCRVDAKKNEVEGLSNQILSVFSCYYVVSGVYLLFLFCERIKIAINM